MAAADRAAETMLGLRRCVMSGLFFGEPAKGEPRLSRGTIPPNMLALSIVIPVYNSEKSLAELHQRLTSALVGLGEYEVILIDDGSRDGSWSAIRSLAQRDARIHGLRMGRNYGQHPALLAGIRAARARTVVTLDDDLQNPPEEIPKLLARLQEGFDVVYGTPQIPRHDPARNLASRVTKLALQAIMGVETARKVSAFRAFHTVLRDSFANYQGPFVNLDVLFTWGTCRFGSVPVHHEARLVGRSGYDLRRLIVHALNMVTGFSAIPLRAATFVGFTFTLFGLAVLAYVLVRYLIAGSTVPGFPFLASLISVMGGAQLFALGIMGEYLARIHFRTMDRPPYFIGATTQQKPDDHP